MMGYGYGGGWMWGFGSLMMLGVLALVGLAMWWAVTVANRPHYSPIIAGKFWTGDVSGRDRTRQFLDQQYAGGELTTDEYTERLRTLGL
jgi:putative membrane protein